MYVAEGIDSLEESILFLWLRLYSMREYCKDLEYIAFKDSYQVVADIKKNRSTIGQ